MSTTSEKPRRERIDEAVALKKKRDLAGALRRLEGLVAEDRSDAYALGHLAHTLLLRGQTRDAIDQARQALELAPGNSFVHYVRGEAHMKLREWDEAADDLEAAIAGGFRSGYLYKRLADARMRRGDPDGARKALEKGLAQYPEDGQLLLALGRLEKKTGDSEAAGRHIEEAAKRLPDDPFAYKELVTTRARARGSEQAIEQLQQLLKVPSKAKNAHIHDELARLLTESRDFDGALASSRRARELAPDNQHLHQRLAYALVKAKRDAEAVVELQSCLDDDPENPTLNRSFIAARRRLGQLDEAHAFYVQQLRRHPEARKIHGYLRRVAREAAPVDDPGDTDF